MVERSENLLDKIEQEDALYESIFEELFAVGLDRAAYKPRVLSDPSYEMSILDDRCVSPPFCDSALPYAEGLEDFERTLLEAERKWHLVPKSYYEGAIDGHPVLRLLHQSLCFRGPGADDVVPVFSRYDGQTEEVAVRLSPFLYRMRYNRPKSEGVALSRHLVQEMVRPYLDEVMGEVIYGDGTRFEGIAHHLGSAAGYTAKHITSAGDLMPGIAEIRAISSGHGAVLTTHRNFWSGGLGEDVPVFAPARLRGEDVHCLDTLLDDFGAVPHSEAEGPVQAIFGAFDDYMLFEYPYVYMASVRDGDIETTVLLFWADGKPRKDAVFNILRRADADAQSAAGST